MCGWNRERMEQTIIIILHAFCCADVTTTNKTQEEDSDHQLTNTRPFLCLLLSLIYILVSS